jgi:hypothetical protein
MSDSGNGIDDIASVLARQAEQAQKDLAAAEAELGQRELQSRLARIAREQAADMYKKLQDVASKYNTDVPTQEWFAAFFGAESTLASPTYEQLKNALKEYDKEVNEILEQWTLPNPPDPALRHAQLYYKAYRESVAVVNARRDEDTSERQSREGLEAALGTLRAAYVDFVTDVKQRWSSAQKLLTEVQAASQIVPIGKPGVQCWRLQTCTRLLDEIRESKKKQGEFARRLKELCLQFHLALEKETKAATALAQAKEVQAANQAKLYGPPPADSKEPTKAADPKTPTVGAKPVDGIKPSGDGIKPSGDGNPAVSTVPSVEQQLYDRLSLVQDKTGHAGKHGGHHLLPPPPAEPKHQQAHT